MPAQIEEISDSENEALASALRYEPDEVFLTDSNGVILTMNETAKKNFPRLTLQSPIFLFIRSPIFKKAFDTALHSNSKLEKVKFVLRGESERHTEAVVIKVRSEERDRIYIRLHDETEQVRAGISQRDFIANVSHELRTPLASIAGFTETLRGAAKDDPEAREKFLEIMAAQAERMNSLILSLLSLSRLELNRHTFPTAKIALKSIIIDAAEALSPLAAKKKILIQTDLKFNEQVLIYGDQDEIFRVFQNLIENSIKYSDNDKKIIVTGERVENELRLIVKDEGFGIAPEHLPRLTERFYRVDEARNRAVGGAGLGLSIVAGIIYRHKGKLDIVSTEGKGSEFHITLPVVTG